MNPVTRTASVQAAIQKNISSIIATMALTKGRYVDGHGNGNEVKTASAIARFSKDGYEHVVLLADKGYFCINPLKLDDLGQVRLSAMSVGGVVNSPNQGSLKAGVEQYNAEATTAKWDIGTIGEIIRF